MGTIWFCLVAIMLAVYVLLDGFDLGAGAIHLLVAKTDAERRQVLASIGPVWDGNEVWLIAAGGTLYFAFPALYASGFSGFYLPLMIVLWLLILRGASIEFRNHIKSAVWDPLWDFLFCGASLLLAVFFGAALGNVVRGVPLDSSGYFFEPLWTNFRLGDEPGILDWYTILVGVLALLAVMMHGGLWVQMKTSGEVNARAGKLAGRAWWGIVALTALVTAVTFRIQPQARENLTIRPWGFILCLPDGHVDQRRLWRVSDGLARAESGLFLDGGDGKSRRLRFESRIDLVAPRNHFGSRIFHLRLSLLCRQSGGRKGPTWLRRLRPSCVFCATRKTPKLTPSE